MDRARVGVLYHGVFDNGLLGYGGVLMSTPVSMGMDALVWIVVIFVVVYAAKILWKNMRGGE